MDTVVLLEITLALLFLLLLVRVIFLRKTQSTRQKPTLNKVGTDKRTHAYQLRENLAVTQSAQVEDDEQSTENTMPQEEREPCEIPEALKQFQLLHEDQIEDDVKEKLLTMSTNIPRPRNIFTPLTLSSYDPKEFAKLVSSDVEIAAKILRTVNSAGFNLSRKITSIQHAVVYFGAAMVKNIAFQMTVQNSFKDGDKRLKNAYHKFWIASFVASSLSLRLAHKFNFDDPSSLATQALLSFIGNLTVMSHNPDMAEEYVAKTSLFERTQHEQETLHANASLIGSMLATHWQLPESLIIGIKQSLVPMAIPPEKCTDSINLRETVLNYICCRIGELVAFHELRDIAKVDISSREELEFVFIDEYLELVGLDKIYWHLSDDRKIRTEINRIISQVSTQL